MTEKEVLKKLGVKNFRQVSKDKVINFASMLNQMDPEVAKKAIEQFPNFAETVSALASDFKTIVEKAMTINSETNTATLEILKSQLDCISEEVHSAKTFEEKKYYLGIMKEIDDQIVDFSKHSQEANNVLVGIVAVSVTVLVVWLGSMLGMNGNINRGQDNDKIE